MKVIVSLIYCFVVIFSIHSCSRDPETSIEVNKMDDINPLDSILGDKLLNETTGEIRQNNFSDFLTISEENLTQNSLLYNIITVGTDCYLISQKKRYSEARWFCAILKVEEGKVVKYEIVNDFQLIDQLNNSTNLYLLLGDFGNYGKKWKSNNNIQLIRYDFDLKEIWSYSPSSDQFPLEGIALKFIDEYISIKIDVITGCHICTNTFELKIDSLGNCISAMEIDKTNSSITFDEKSISKMFLKNTHNTK